MINCINCQNERSICMIAGTIVQYHYFYNINMYRRKALQWLIFVF